MNPITKLLSVAFDEVGYLEKANGKQLYDKTANAGNANYTKYGYEMHKLFPSTMDYPAAWCDCFVDWCFVKAFGAETAVKLLHKFDDYTVNSAGYYKNNGEWHKTPKKGDQIFFTNSKGGICHTGLVYAVDGGNVYTIEGNTSSSSGVVANGGCVRKKSYKLNYSRIAGYGRPNYSLVYAPSWSETAVSYTGTITVDSTLNVRKQPIVGAEIIAKHVGGDVVEIVAKTDNGWYRVDYPNIGTGYIHSDYVSVVENAPIYEDKPADVTLDNTPDYWAENAVFNTINKGILTGDENGNYKLHDYCTRQEMLVFLYRAYKAMK